MAPAQRRDAVLRLLSGLVGASERPDWRREWEAELATARARSRSRLRLYGWATEDALRVAGRRLAGAWPRADVTFALRSLRRAPGYALAVVSTLALGIGANTAIFTVVDASLIRPLALERSERVVLVEKTRDGRMGHTSAPNYLDWETGSRSFQGLAAVQMSATTLTGLDAPLRVGAALVRPGFFRTVGVRPLLGRTFLPDEGEAGRDDVAVLSHELWVDAYGADPAVLGRTVVTSGEARTVVGVLPPGLRIPPFTSSIWLPLAFSPDALDARGRNNLLVVGRLGDGVELEAAQAEMDAIAARLAEAYPSANEGWGVAVRPLHSAVVGTSAGPLWTLFGAAGFVLLIAAVNVASLVLARGVSRERELAVRVSLGASRARIGGQLLGETLVLALLGGAAGVALASALIGPIRALVPGALASVADPTVDARIVAFALTVALGAGVLAGLAPALRLSRWAAGAGAASVGGRLRERGSVRGVGMAPVTVQLALTTVLLVGAGLMMRSLSALYSVDLGLEPEGVSAFGVTFPESTYPGATDVARAVDALVERLGSPRSAAAAGSHLPLSGARLSSSVLLEGRPEDMSTNGPSGAIKVVTPGYFDVLGIPLLAGRDFTSTDEATTEPVAIVNRRAAERYWPGEEALGRWIAYESDDAGGYVRRRVVGIVGDVHYAGPGQEPVPEVYEPHRQTDRVWRWFGRSMSFVVRATDGAPLSLAAAREAVATVDGDLPVVGLRALPEVLHASVGTPRFHGTLISLFAGLSLLLAMVGLYGVMAFGVRRRRREMGVRMALGASARAVVGSVLRRAVSSAGLGAGMGLAAAALLARLVSGMVWGVAPHDPWTYAGAALALLAVASAAAAVPALNAGRADPAETLSVE